MQVLKDEVRQSIRDAAIMNFKEHGYPKASMRRIAEDAGMSVGNLYRYYKNKETLFGDLVRPMIDVFLANQRRNKKFKLELVDVNLLEHSAFVEQLIEARLGFKDELYILFLRGEGSPYAGAKEVLKHYLEENAKSFLEENGMSELQIFRGSQFIRVSTSSIVEAFCMVLEVSKSETDFLINMLEFIELVIKPAIRNLIAIRDKNTTFRRISDEEIYRFFSDRPHHRNHSGSEGDESDEPTGDRIGGFRRNGRRS